VVIVATGSEVSLALEAKALLGTDDIRVVSMTCRELFLKTPRATREQIVPAGTVRVVIEAGVSQGWEGIAGDSGIVLSIESFGKSAPLKDLCVAFGFAPAAVAAKVKEAVSHAAPGMRDASRQEEEREEGTGKR